MGEMLREIPKASGGDRRSDSFKNQPSVIFEKPKTETLADMGITRNAASQYQQMAEHPEIVEQAIQEARENDDIGNHWRVDLAACSGGDCPKTAEKGNSFPQLGKTFPQKPPTTCTYPP